MFNANELEEGTNQLVDLGMGVWDVFVTMSSTPWLFKTVTNFKLVKFDELATIVVPTIERHAHSIGGHHNLNSN
jgi:hypothetical protein